MFLKVTYYVTLKSGKIISNKRTHFFPIRLVEITKGALQVAVLRFNTLKAQINLAFFVDDGHANMMLRTYLRGEDRATNAALIRDCEGIEK